MLYVNNIYRTTTRRCLDPEQDLPHARRRQAPYSIDSFSPRALPAYVWSTLDQLFRVHALCISIWCVGFVLVFMYQVFMLLLSQIMCSWYFVIVIVIVLIYYVFLVFVIMFRCCVLGSLCSCSMFCLLLLRPLRGKREQQ